MQAVEIFQIRNSYLSDTLLGHRFPILRVRCFDKLNHPVFDYLCLETEKVSVQERLQEDTVRHGSEGGLKTTRETL